VIIAPEPTEDEAVAIAAAVQAVLDAERTRVPSDPRPAAYRSGWRRAALAEGAGLTLDNAGRSCVS
jgi:hypothetical protein